MYEKSRFLFSLTLLVCFGVFCCDPASAETSWQLRIGGLWFDSDGASQQVLIDGGRAESIIEPDFGLTATTEFRFNDRIGIEFGAILIGSPELRAQIDSGFESIEVRDSFDMHVLGAGINFHLTPDRKVDVYLDPFIGHAIFSDLVFVVTDDDVRFGVGDELAYGAVIGIDVPFEERWSFNAAVRYFDLEIEPRDLAGVNANPIDLETRCPGCWCWLSLLACGSRRLMKDRARDTARRHEPTPSPRKIA